MGLRFWVKVYVLGFMFLFFEFLILGFRVFDFKFYILTYNKMDVSFRVKVEWGIRRLKCNWKKVMKYFCFTKDKYNHLFKITALLINFFHMCPHDFTFEVIGKHLDDLTTDG